MIVELIPGEGERISAVFGIEKSIVLVLVASNTDTGEVIVINPDLGGLVDINQVLALRCAVELEIADNDVVGLADLESTIRQTSVAAYTKHGGVAENLDNATAGKGSLDLDHASVLGGGSELSARSNSGSCTAATSGGASSEANKLIDFGSTLLERCSACGGRGGQSNSCDLEELHVEL